MKNPLADFPASVMAALMRDLPAIHEPAYGERPACDRRPFMDEISITSFEMDWPNTSCGFNLHSGFAGQAFTVATMVAVVHGDDACVYSQGRLLYGCKANEDFHEMLRDRHFPSQRDAIRGRRLAGIRAEGKEWSVFALDALDAEVRRREEEALLRWQKKDEAERAKKQAEPPRPPLMFILGSGQTIPLSAEDE